LEITFTVVIRYIIKSATVTKSLLGNWSLNLNYWTAGRNTSDGPIWCSTLKTISNASANIFGYGSTANKGKECLQLKITQEALNVFKWRLQFKNCKERLIFVCEVNVFTETLKSFNFFVSCAEKPSAIKRARSQTHPTEVKAGKQKLHEGLCEERSFVRQKLPLPER
jgi:hypothetical protein